MLAVFFAFAAFLFLFAPSGAFAAVVTWDGGGANENWNTAANWSGDVAPGASDVATFNTASVKNATINANLNIAGINIQSGYSGIITQATGITVSV